MEFKKFYQILAFLLVASAASHVSLPSEAYWNSMLPNSPMPKAVKDLLQPQKVADSIPFSTNKLPEIFSKFSVDPSSNEAEMMRKTIEECEDTTEINGEEKFCATSLESMIDFSISKIGKNAEGISTNAESESTLKYRIVGVKKMPSEKAVVVCHRQEYAYAVFYCHKTETTVSYQVLMVGADWSKAEAVAVCHQDTAAWNPKHLAFQVLKVKPGSVPVCHFLPQDHVVWVPKN